MVTLSPAGVTGAFPVQAIHGDPVSIAWSQMGFQARQAEMVARPGLRDPAMAMDLPRVGQREICLRPAKL